MIRLEINPIRRFLKALAGLENGGFFRILYLLLFIASGWISPAMAQPEPNQPKVSYQSVIIPQPQVFVENRQAEVFNWTSFLRVSIDTQFSSEERKIIAQRLEEAVRIYQFSKFFDSDVVRVLKGGYEQRFFSFKSGLQPIGELDHLEIHRKKGSKKRKASHYPDRAQIGIAESRGRLSPRHRPRKTGRHRIASTASTGGDLGLKDLAAIGGIQSTGIARSNAH